jgi:hypothetical protein
VGKKNERTAYFKARYTQLFRRSFVKFRKKTKYKSSSWRRLRRSTEKKRRFPINNDQMIKSPTKKKGTQWISIPTEIYCKKKRCDVMGGEETVVIAVVVFA